MQLDERWLLMPFVLHLFVLVVYHCRFCGKSIVPYVPTDMRKVSSTKGFRKASSQDNG